MSPHTLAVRCSASWTIPIIPSHYTQWYSHCSPLRFECRAWGLGRTRLCSLSRLERLVCRALLCSCRHPNATSTTTARRARAQPSDRAETGRRTEAAVAGEVEEEEEGAAGVGAGTAGSVADSARRRSPSNPRTGSSRPVSRRSASPPPLIKLEGELTLARRSAAPMRLQRPRTSPRMLSVPTLPPTRRRCTSPTSLRRSPRRNLPSSSRPTRPSEPPSSYLSTPLPTLPPPPTSAAPQRTPSRSKQAATARASRPRAASATSASSSARTRNSVSPSGERRRGSPGAS